MRNIMLLMMGGSGRRFGAEIPKQFVEVDSIPVFAYILKGYDDCSCIDDMVVVTHPDWDDFVKEWEQRLGIKKLRAIADGGETRSESVKNGLIAAREFASEQDIVLIHDATHPYVDEPGVEAVIEAVKECGGSTLAQRQFDTCYQMDPQTGMICKVIPRQEFISGASPEAFFYGQISEIYMNATKEELERMSCAGAIALEHSIPMKVVDSNVLNLKITYAPDMELFRHIKDYYFKGKVTVEK